ncbi:MAG: 30S ribosomal protein S4 [Candidatus Diapherotrites archaeon]
MGDPKRIRKKYFMPKKPWDSAAIEKEGKIVELYGLKNKKEIRKAETFLRKKRQTARKLLTLKLEERIKKEKELIESLKRIGMLKEGAILDDVLVLNTKELFERRLQTLVWRKGLANTAKQARQFITHGHISINGKKVTVPSYIVTPKEEGSIKYYKKEMQLKPKEKKIEIKKEFEEEVPKEEVIPAGEEVREAEKTKEKKDEKTKKPKKKKPTKEKEEKEKGEKE